MATTTRAKSQTPPGPRGLPVVGSLLALQKNPHLKLQDYARQYGDVCMLRMGRVPTVVISHPEIMREALMRQELSDRWQSQTLERFIGDYPTLIYGHYNERWRTLQRYANRNVLSHRRVAALREPYLEPMMDMLLENVGQLADSGEPMRPRELMSAMNARTMIDIIFGIFGLSQTDEMNLIVRDILRVVNIAFSRYSLLAPISPVRYLPPWFESAMLPLLLWLVRRSRQPMARIQIEDFRDHPLMDLDHPTCLLEIMLADERHGEIEIDVVGALVADLLIAGIDTNSQTMSWLIQNMAIWPEIQDRVYNELTAFVVDAGREPDMDDMPKLPYTHAVLIENLRFTAVTAFSIPHRASEECEVEGYTIPKGAQIIPNLYGVLHDERFWDAPNEFRPERFLPEADGSPSKNLENPAFIPFGVGRRACPGQGLAMTILWIQTVRLFRKFRFEAPPGGLKGETECGLTMMPKPYSVNVHRR